MTSRATTCRGRGWRAAVTVAWQAAFVCAIAVVCVSARATAGVPLSVAAPRDEAKLARLVDDVREQAQNYRLDEPDVPGQRGRIMPVTQALLDSDRVFRASALARAGEFGSSPFYAVSHENDTNLRVVVCRLHRLGIERDELRRFETDPARVWPRIDGTLRSMLAGKPGSLCRHLKTATRRMRGVPEELRAARIAIRAPSRLAVEAAIASFTRTLALFRMTMPAALLDCREPAAVGDFAVADTLASRSLDEYIQWLQRDVLPGANGDWAMGGDTYSRWLLATTGTDPVTPGELRARARSELDSLPTPDSSAAVLRADSLRAAWADSILEVRALRQGRTGSRGLRTVLGRRELAWAWAAYSAQLRALPRGSAGTAMEASVRIAPSRLDLAAMIAEIDLQTGAASFDDARRQLERDAGIDSLAAQAEAREAALQPVRAAAAITAWQLEALRRDVEQRLGARRFSARAFLDAVIDEGAAPAPSITGPLYRRLRVRPPAGLAR